MSRTITISKDYTRFPGGRYVEDGAGNGTTFREDFMKPEMARQDGSVIRVVLDGAAGYPSSFLEEAFGGLVRVDGFAAKDVLNRFEFVANEPGFARYIELIKQYVRQAQNVTRQN
ncbi:MAG: DUF4325 domain-containing protein [Rhodobacteraceae bacterium]|nr:DUF4325 domain-containing protein [Paracoccaceae bacterium]